MTQTFNASELCKLHKRKLTHFLDNKYVQNFMRQNDIPYPTLRQGRGKTTELDTRLQPLLEWWLARGYNYVDDSLCQATIWLEKKKGTLND